MERKAQKLRERKKKEQAKEGRKVQIQLLRERKENERKASGNISNDESSDIQSDVSDWAAYSSSEDEEWVDRSEVFTG